MNGLWWIVPVACVGLIILMGVLLPRWRSHQEDLRLTEAQREFQRRREWLEARFLTLASQSGKPRGLCWVDCDFENAVSFARDRNSGQLRALVGVTISFAAIEGGDMEDVEAVGNLRAATAVFNYSAEWVTDGRAVFNLNPVETIQHYQHELELVDDRRG